MKRFIITILAVTVVCVSALYAQLPNIIRNDMVINGLTLCQSYTQEQMIAALGQPDSISVYTGEAGVINKYYYGKDFFTVIEEERLFVDFTVTNPRFKFNNFISVGDPVARVVLLGGIITNSELVNRHGVLVKYKMWRLAKETNEDKHYSSIIKFAYDDEGCITKIEAIYNRWF